MTSKPSEEVKPRMVSKEESFWTTARDELTKQNEQLEHQITINAGTIEMAKEKIKKEKENI